MQNIRSLSFVLLVCVTILTGCGGNQLKIGLLHNSLIVAFGDSLTRGTGTALTSSYPAMLEHELGITVINDGVPGEVSAQGLIRLQSVLQQHRPTLVILCHGGNDILRKLSREALKNNLSAMIELIQSYGSEVLLVGVPEPAFSLSSLSLYEDLADQHMLVAELNALPNLLEDPEMKSDRVHLYPSYLKMPASELSQRFQDKAHLRRNVVTFRTSVTP